jgi:hypothetical protein
MLRVTKQREARAFHPECASSLHFDWLKDDNFGCDGGICCACCSAPSPRCQASDYPEFGWTMRQRTASPVCPFGVHGLSPSLQSAAAEFGCGKWAQGCWRNISLCFSPSVCLALHALPMRVELFGQSAENYSGFSFLGRLIAGTPPYRAVRSRADGDTFGPISPSCAASRMTPIGCGVFMVVVVGSAYLIIYEDFFLCVGRIVLRELCKA